MRLHIIPVFIFSSLKGLQVKSSYKQKVLDVLHEFSINSFVNVRSCNSSLAGYYGHTRYKIHKDILKIINEKYKFSKYIFYSSIEILIQCKSRTIYKELRFFNQKYISNKFKQL